MNANPEKNNDRNLTKLATKEALGRLERKIDESEARIAMRMFYFWIGQVAVIAGLLAYFFKTMH